MRVFPEEETPVDCVASEAQSAGFLTTKRESCCTYHSLIQGQHTHETFRSKEQYLEALVFFVISPNFTLKEIHSSSPELLTVA